MLSRPSSFRLPTLGDVGPLVDSGEQSITSVGTRIAAARGSTEVHGGRRRSGGRWGRRSTGRSPSRSGGA